MALIKCSECEKDVSDKASFCPNCGCPVEASIAPVESNIEPEQTFITPTETIDFQAKTESASSKAWNMLQTGIQTKIENNRNAIKATKSIGPVQIDENHRMFRINGAVPVNGKKDGFTKTMFKGAMAVGTLGMSVAAEKLVGGGKKRVGNKEWLEYSDLIAYDLLEDDSLVTSGGVGQALVSGALFGGLGAVAGAITGKRVQKKKIESLIIKITVNNFGFPCIMIPLITKPTKTNSKEYQTAFNLAHQILSTLDVITHNK